MGSSKKRSKAGNGRTVSRRSGSPVEDAKKHSDRNKQRRQKYADDPEYAAEQRRRFRTYYREARNLTARGASILAGGKLLARAQSKEVVIHYSGGKIAPPVVTHCYTVREASQALARSELTLRRWIKQGIVPRPRLHDTSYGYMHYSRGELKVIARILARHEEEFDYLHKKHTSTIRSLWTAVESYRSSKV